MSKSVLKTQCVKPKEWISHGGMLIFDSTNNYEMSSGLCLMLILRIFRWKDSLCSEGLAASQGSQWMTAQWERCSMADVGKGGPWTALSPASGTREVFTEESLELTKTSNYFILILFHICLFYKKLEKTKYKQEYKNTYSHILGMTIVNI